MLISNSFQNIQSLSPLDSSIRLLPGLVASVMITSSTGHFVHKLSISTTLSILSVLAGLSPLLMALTNPIWPYWYEAFPAQVSIRSYVYLCS
jgi:hypothetical protein